MLNLKLLGTVLILVAAGALTACDQNDGPTEKAGESIDRAVDDTKESIDDAKDEVKDATN